MFWLSACRHKLTFYPVLSYNFTIHLLTFLILVFHCIIIWIREAEQMLAAARPAASPGRPVSTNTNFYPETALFSFFTGFNRWVRLFWRRGDPLRIIRLPVKTS